MLSDDIDESGPSFFCLFNCMVKKNILFDTIIDRLLYLSLLGSINNVEQCSGQKFATL